MSVDWFSTGSGNGLSLAENQAITWSNADLNYCQLDLWEQTSMKFELTFQHFSFNKMYLKMSSAKWQLFCLGGDELTYKIPWYMHIVLLYMCFCLLHHIDQVTKGQLSCHLVLLSVDSKTSWQDSYTFVTCGAFQKHLWALKSKSS